MFHDNFKIISNGRELPYPIFRLLALVLIGFVGGYIPHLIP
jgi:hypothetical protein